MRCLLNETETLPTVFEIRLMKGVDRKLSRLFRGCGSKSLTEDKHLSRLLISSSEKAIKHSSFSGIEAQRNTQFADSVAALAFDPPNLKPSSIYTLSRPCRTSSQRTCNPDISIAIVLNCACSTVSRVEV